MTPENARILFDLETALKAMELYIKKALAIVAEIKKLDED
jgi:hypothetical protein